MLIEIGHVEAIFRYPVKSMGGERLEVANLGWHGLDGDRRLAFRRSNEHSGFPWLTASKLPELLLFAPLRREGDAGEGKVIQDWEKTSLKPYVDYFRSFVVALIRDEKGVKIKRERDETAPSAEAMEF